MKHQSQKIVMLGVAKQTPCRGREVKFQQAPSAGEWEVTNNSTSHTNSCLLIFILPVWNSVNISLLLDVTTVKKTHQTNNLTLKGSISEELKVILYNGRKTSKVSILKDEKAPKS
jgi:hypothetical protein